MNYTPNFDLQLARGQVFEKELREILCNDKRAIKIECKTDFHPPTGNMAIEIMRKGQPAAFSTTEAEWWFYYFKGKGQGVFIKTERLRTLVKRYSHKQVVGGPNNENLLVLVPLREIWGED